MRRLLKTLTFISLSLLATTAEAQEKWTLDRCIGYALENNLQIKQQVLTAQQSDNAYLQSRLALLPTFSFSGGQNFNWGRSVNLQDLQIIENKLSQSTSASLSSSLTAFSGLTKINTVKSNRVQQQIALANVEKLKNEISISIAQAYLQILLSMEILDSYNQSLESLSSQEKRTAILVDAGSQPYSDLLDIQSQLASERVQVVSAENQVTNNKLALAQLLDLPLNQDFDIAVPDLGTPPEFTGEDVEAIYMKAQTLPQIKSAQYGLDKSRIALDIAKGERLPSIGISAGYGTYYSDARDGAFLEQFKDNRNPSVGISLSVPIFEGGRFYTNVKDAKLSVKSYEIALQSEKQTLLKEIQKAVTDAYGYYHQYEAAKVNVAAMEESFRLVEQKFNVGSLNSTDYIVARTNLYKAKSNLSQMKYQYLFQLKILDFYKGKPLTL
jgi:outer membrane protein